MGTGEVTFNETGADVDFRIEGDTNANLFKIDAGNEQVGIGHQKMLVLPCLFMFIMQQLMV